MRSWAKPGKFAWFVQVVSTFVIVIVGWVFFRAQSFRQAFDVLHSMFAGGAGDVLLVPWTMCAVVFYFAFEWAAEFGRAATWQKLAAPLRVVAMSILLVVLELFSYQGESASFIYFKF